MRMPVRVLNGEFRTGLGLLGGRDKSFMKTGTKSLKVDYVDGGLSLSLARHLG
jgi:hypothetical protein